MNTQMTNYLSSPVLLKAKENIKNPHFLKKKRIMNIMLALGWALF